MCKVHLIQKLISSTSTSKTTTKEEMLDYFDSIVLNNADVVRNGITDKLDGIKIKVRVNSTNTTMVCCEKTSKLGSQVL